MYRLIYISSVHEDCGSTDLEAILSDAQRHNSVNDVTGLLMFNGLNFMQILEGTRKAVESTYGRIVSDARHYAIVTLLAEPAERIFDDWSMVLKHVPATASGGFKSGDDLTGIVDRDIPPHVRLLITNFDTLKG